MNIKHLTVNFETKSLDEKGTFSGYASVFDVKDNIGDVVRKGAFVRSLGEWAAKGRLPPILWQHKQNEPIGYFSQMKEDDTGLYVEGRLLIDEIPQAKSAHALLKNGVLGGMSIGYNIVGYDYDKVANIMNLNELKLWEVSLVTFPCNESATVNRVKFDPNQIPTQEHIIKCLTEFGFSPESALAFCERGYKGLLPENHSVKQDIINAIHILKGK